MSSKRPFQVLGLQQVAIGGPDKQRLRKLWVDLFGLEVAGTFLNQRAYHAGPLSRSMPVVNVASVLIGGLFGILVFGELPRHDPVSLAFQAAGIGLACLGLVMLTRHEATPALDSERRSNLVS